jgi:hypothetical protein
MFKRRVGYLRPAGTEVMQAKVEHPQLLDQNKVLGLAASIREAVLLIAS